MTSEGVTKSRLQNSLLLIFEDKSRSRKYQTIQTVQIAVGLLNMDQTNLGLHCLEKIIHVDSMENSVYWLRDVER